LGKYYAPTPEPTPTPKPVQTSIVAPTPTPDRSIRNGPLPYALKEKAMLDETAILPELKDIYVLNKDLIGWISIPDTVIDYPVVQAEDGEFYLTHDFYGEENVNGQIILDVLCDPYTPSYNLVVSGHHMKNGTMFGSLPEYRNKCYWEKHRFLEFDTLMERKLYVIFACFYSADYDEDETGFRYNAIIDYKIDADRWLAEIEANQLYDTGIEREFGDEFITLTTCDRARHRNGRFVVVGRKIREGETFE
jgi:sortase B